MKFKKFLIIFGQIITISLALLFGTFLIYLKIPGNGALCDPEQIMYAGTWFVFILLVLGILINSLNNYVKGKWKSYRIVSITLIITLLISSIFTRNIVMAIYYGKEKNVIEVENPQYVKIRLFENGRFFAYTYDASCETENIGTYKLSNHILKLTFENEKSKYLGTTYIIQSNNVRCLDCKDNYELMLKQIIDR